MPSGSGADEGVCMNDWPLGDSDMAARVRAFDWAATSLGPIEAWSPRLKTLVDLLFDSRQAMLLAVGPKLETIYNDAYIVFLPRACIRARSARRSTPFSVASPPFSPTCRPPQPTASTLTISLAVTVTSEAPPVLAGFCLWGGARPVHRPHSSPARPSFALAGWIAPELKECGQAGSRSSCWSSMSEAMIRHRRPEGS
jgi:hypothetical protein